MNLKAAFLLVASVALGVFTILNWGAMSASTTLDLAIATVEAPLGLILLGVVVLVTLLATLLVALHQAQMLVEVHRMEKESRAQRELASKAEASRLSQLGVQIEQQFVQLGQTLEAKEQRWREDAGQAQAALEERMGEEMRSLAAQLGEMEDRLDRLLAPRDTPRLP